MHKLPPQVMPEVAAAAAHLSCMRQDRPCPHGQLTLRSLSGEPPASPAPAMSFPSRYTIRYWPGPMVTAGKVQAPEASGESVSR